MQHIRTQVEAPDPEGLDRSTLPPAPTYRRGETRILATGHVANETLWSVTAFRPQLGPEPRRDPYLLSDGIMAR